MPADKKKSPEKRKPTSATLVGKAAQARRRERLLAAGNVRLGGRPAPQKEGK